MKRVLAACALALALVVSASAATTLNNVATVQYDMQPTNEGVPLAHSSAWGTAGLSYNLPPAGATKVQEWGVIGFDSSNTNPAGSRVEVKNFEAYVWSLSQKRWTRVQATLKPQGAYYQFSPTGPTTSPVTWRAEPDGGVSATMKGGWVLHFFGSPQWTLPLSGVNSRADIGAVFTTYQVRSLGPASKFIAQAGCDFWGKYSFTTSPNVGVAHSKWVYAQSAWRAVSMYTGGPSSVIATAKYPASAWTESQIAASPPTMDGMGLP